MNLDNWERINWLLLWIKIILSSYLNEDHIQGTTVYSVNTKRSQRAAARVKSAFKPKRNKKGFVFNMDLWGYDCFIVVSILSKKLIDISSLAKCVARIRTELSLHFHRVDRKKYLLSSSFVISLNLGKKKKKKRQGWGNLCKSLKTSSSSELRLVCFLRPCYLANIIHFLVANTYTYVNTHKCICTHFICVPPCLSFKIRWFLFRYTKFYAIHT